MSENESVNYIVRKLYDNATDRIQDADESYSEQTPDDLDFTEDEVNDIVKNIKKHIAPVHDNLSPVFIMPLYLKHGKFF